MAQNDRIVPMGLTVTDGAIHVCIDAAADSCSLVLFRKGEKESFRVIPFPQEDRMGDVWFLKIDTRQLEDVPLPELEYGFEIDGRYRPDPYGRCYANRTVWGDLEQAQRPLRAVPEPDSFDWEGDRPLEIPYEDTILYRIHVRGFTKHSSSRVEDKGTFRAAADKIPYLQDLGVTAVELMPCAEFQEIVMPEELAGNPYGADKPTGRINYWGYTKAMNFAPKAAYSPAKGRGPVQEFKSMVKAFHKAGIEVIVELYFTGKENPTAALEMVRFWVREFHVDGVHLAGYPPTGLIGSDPYLSRTKLFAVSWEGVKPGRIKHLGEYHDGFQVDMRRFLKGDEDQINQLIFRSRQNPKSTGVINYMANSNGFTLMDMVSYDRKHNMDNGEDNQDGNDYNYSWNCGIEGPTKRKKIVELRKQQIRNALLLLFLSQGTPLLLSGDEYGNSQNGNNNAYCQDNEISWLNWNQQKSHSDLYEFTRRLIRFRKDHPVFHMSQEPRGVDYTACGYPDVSYHGVNAWCPEFENFRRQLGIMYCGTYAKKADGTADDFFFVAYNMHWEYHEFDLPTLPKHMRWKVCIDTSAADVNGFYEKGQEIIAEDQKDYKVPPRTVVVLIGC